MGTNKISCGAKIILIIITPDMRVSDKHFTFSTKTYVVGTQ